MKSAFAMLIVACLAFFHHHQVDAVTYPPGDLNCSGSVNIADAVFIINYIFGGGPVPQQCSPVDVDSTIFLYWTSPGDPDVSSYEVRWAYDYATILAWDSAYSVVWVGSNYLYPTYPLQRNGLPVWGIRSDSLYFFGVKTIDSSGHWSDVSNIISVMKID